MTRCRWGRAGFLCSFCLDVVRSTTLVVIFVHFCVFFHQLFSAFRRCAQLASKFHLIVLPNSSSFLCCRPEAILARCDFYDESKTTESTVALGFIHHQPHGCNIFAAVVFLYVQLHANPEIRTKRRFTGAGMRQRRRRRRQCNDNWLNVILYGYWPSCCLGLDTKRSCPQESDFVCKRISGKCVR